MRFTSLLPAALCLIAMVAFVGCEQPTENHGDDHSHADHDHDHDHGDHDHDHGDHDHTDGDHDHADHPAHGPNNGHMFAFDNAEFQGEWCKYKDNNVIRMYLLDKSGKEAAPLKVDSFVVKPLVGNDDSSFELTAENADADGMASTFMLDDQTLSIAIPLGVKIVVTAGDQTMTGEIKADEPLEH